MSDWFRVDAVDVFTPEYEQFVRGHNEAAKVEALDYLENQMIEMGYSEADITRARVIAEAKMAITMEELTQKFLRDVRRAASH